MPNISTPKVTAVIRGNARKKIDKRQWFQDLQGKYHHPVNSPLVPLLTGDTANNALADEILLGHYEESPAIVDRPGTPTTPFKLPGGKGEYWEQEQKITVSAEEMKARGHVTEITPANRRQVARKQANQNQWIINQEGRFHHPTESILTSALEKETENNELADQVLAGIHPDSPGTTRPGTPNTPHKLVGQRGGEYWDENGQYISLSLKEMKARDHETLKTSSEYRAMARNTIKREQWVRNQKGKFHHPIDSTLVSALEKDTQDNELADEILAGTDPKSPGVTRPGTPNTPYKLRNGSEYWLGDKRVFISPKAQGKKVVRTSAVSRAVARNQQKNEQWIQGFNGRFHHPKRSLLVTELQTNESVNAFLAGIIPGSSGTLRPGTPNTPHRLPGGGGEYWTLDGKVTLSAREMTARGFAKVITPSEMRSDARKKIAKSQWVTNMNERHHHPKRSRLLSALNGDSQDDALANVILAGLHPYSPGSTRPGTPNTPHKPQGGIGGTYQDNERTVVLSRKEMTKEGKATIATPAENRKAARKKIIKNQWVTNKKGLYHHPKRSRLNPALTGDTQDDALADKILEGTHSDSPGSTRPGTPTHPHKLKSGGGEYWLGKKRVFIPAKDMKLQGLTTSRSPADERSLARTKANSNLWIPNKKGLYHHPKRSRLIPALSGNTQDDNLADQILEGTHPRSPGTTRPGTPTTPHRLVGHGGEYWEGDRKTTLSSKQMADGQYNKTTTPSEYRAIARNKAKKELWIPNKKGLHHHPQKSRLISALNGNAQDDALADKILEGTHPDSPGTTRPGSPLTHHKLIGGGSEYWEDGEKIVVKKRRKKIT